MTDRKRPYRSRVASKYLLAKRSGKKAEKQLVLEFLHRLQLKPKQVRSSERPDFRLFFPETEVGLELTLLYSDTTSRGSKDRQAFESWYRLALSLRQELISAGLPYVYGTVSFKNKEQLLRVPARKFIQEIVTFCKANRIKRRDCISFTQFAAFPTLETYVSSIHVDSTYPSKGVLWWCEHLQSGYVTDAVPALIESIGNKERLARNYSWKAGQEKWLLVVARALMLADTGLLDQTELELVNKQASVQMFDRIYYWDCFSEKVWEVWPRPRILLDGGAAKIYVSRLPFAKSRSL
jgi:hypothetical protein